MSHYALRTATLRTRSQRGALRLLNLFGWTVRCKPLPGPHGVVIIYPHTSRWDYLVGLLAKVAVGLPFHWLARESLMTGWRGRLLARWGALPVQRHAPGGATAQLASRIHDEDWFWVALAPEGTRHSQPHWRSGFYHLAHLARVPLALVYIDYASREIGLVDTVRLSGDQQADMAAIALAYRGREGRHPERAAPIILAPPRSGDTGKQA